MTATMALDQSGVEYYFTCVSGGGHDSGWQDSAAYEDSGLVTNTVYAYTVTARDKNPNHNTTAPSQVSSARTSLPGDFEPDGDVVFDDYSRFASHWPNDGAFGSEYDLDDDNDVDTRDLAILVGNWLEVAEQPLPLPGQADNPNPPDEAPEVDIETDLSWTAGSYATSHDVYFGTSNPPALQGNQTDTVFTPSAMTYLTTY